MNNYFAELVFAQEKFLANPKQILVTLFCQRDTWPYAGVNKKIIATCE